MSKVILVSESLIDYEKKKLNENVKRAYKETDFNDIDSLKDFIRIVNGNMLWYDRSRPLSTNKSLEIILEKSTKEDLIEAIESGKEFNFQGYFTQKEIKPNVYKIVFSKAFNKI